MNNRLIRAFLPPAVLPICLTAFMALGVVVDAVGAIDLLRTIVVSLGGFIVLCGLFLPTIVAAFREKRNYVAILVLNCFGLLIIPWIIALVWAFTVDPSEPSPARSN